MKFQPGSLLLNGLSVLEQIVSVVNEIERLIGIKQWKDAKTATIKLKYLEGIQSAAREKMCS